MKSSHSTKNDANIGNQKDPDEEMSVLDPYEDEEIKPEAVTPGPLTMVPGLRHLVPALALLLVFYSVSSLGIRYSFTNELTANGEAVYGNSQYWRLLTALAVHGDIVHLLSNGLVLVFFGWMLRAYFGFVVFPLIAIVIGIATNAAVVFIYRPSMSVIGCSGMTHGMVSLWLALYLRHDVDNSFAKRILRVAGFVLIMMVPSAFQENVSYLSHLAGFIVGILAGAVIIPFSVVRDPS